MTTKASGGELLEAHLHVAAALEVLESDFVRFARAKGLTDWGVFRHVVKNAAPTALAPQHLRMFALIVDYLLVVVGDARNAFYRCGERGVLALLSDSTNSEREGATVPDSRIGETFAQIVAHSPGRIIVAVDGRGPRVAVKGWTETAAVRATDLVRGLAGLPVAAEALVDAATRLLVEMHDTKPTP